MTMMGLSIALRTCFLPQTASLTPVPLNRLPHPYYPNNGLPPASGSLGLIMPSLQF
uniref:Uncharacterized protein n=1 Tax=Picea glauca TaxID=3330 RepID=A0A117NG93_PICGL|nr:hypothetical protein ABT39_MTgene1564 [Picea glauca]